MKYFLSLLLFLVLVLPASAREVNITFFQLNDVYEITPVNGGLRGGTARVATLLKALKKKNPNTYSILAGDLFSPSAVGTAKVNGTSLAGEQIVDVFNEMGWDYFTLGNHEFDLKKPDFKKRLKEAKFRIFTSNVFDASTGKPFDHTEGSIIFKVEGVSVGLVGVTMTGLGKDYVKVTDPVGAAKAEVRRLKSKNINIVVVVSHQALADDIRLAEEVPEADLIIGGHEHENMNILRGPDFTPITKADANAKSAFVIDLTYDTDSKKLTIDPKLHLITDEIAEDPGIKKVVKKWMDVAFDAFRKQGLEPDQVVCKLTEELDGLESSIRNKSTRLTRLTADSLYHSFKDTDLSILNVGTIRIDDVLPAGYDLLEYDVLRILPFGGTMSNVSMPGSTLRRALEAGSKNQGNGGFLDYSNVEFREGSWKVAGKDIDDNKIYKVAATTYLVENGDTNLEFLKMGDGSTVKPLPDEPVDMKKALIAELKKVYGQ
ncbi:MAG: bifunctional metallophosphatase/5'-nucleotidase [bacterium]|nr:bifunctional metallophosphatase/5'-nucleotidase [bacterium]